MQLLQLLKSKTIVFSIILAALSVAQGYIGLLPMTPVHQMYIGIGISVIVAVLRAVTNQPISEK
jgi:low affinity Fe/Cu permease